MASPELPPPTDEKKTRITVYLQPSLSTALKVEAAQRNMTLGQIVEEALRSRVTPTWK